MRVGDADEASFRGQDLGYLLLASNLLFQFLLQHRQRRHANQVALANRSQPLGPQHNVQSLVPGHVAHLYGDLSLHLVRSNDVHLPHVG